MRCVSILMAIRLYGARKTEEWRPPRLLFAKGRLPDILLSISTFFRGMVGVLPLQDRIRGVPVPVVLEAS